MYYHNLTTVFSFIHTLRKVFPLSSVLKEPNASKFVLQDGLICIRSAKKKYLKLKVQFYQENIYQRLMDL